MKLKCVTYKKFLKKRDFCGDFLSRNAFLKFENIYNFDTYFHPLRNIVLKRFDDKCKARACEILTQSY